jgi:hypothetical protein
LAHVCRNPDSRLIRKGDFIDHFVVAQVEAVAGLGKGADPCEAMGRNIGHELAEIEQAIDSCRGDFVAEPRLTDTWMAHLLISSRELLHRLLIPQPSTRENRKPMAWRLPVMGVGLQR